MSGLGLLGKLKQRRGDAKLEYEWGSSKVLQTLDLDKLPRAALRSHLDARDLETGGTKRAMVKRLQADLEGERLQATAYTEQLESEFHINKDIEERGSVYACGTNYAGQLGQGDTEPRSVFTAVQKTRGIGVIKVATNADMIYAVTADHEVLVWGGSGAGSTGIQIDGDDEWAREIYMEPQFVTELQGEEATACSVGASHATVCTSGGDVFVWGHNLAGQLGLTDFEKRPLPTILTYFENDPDIRVRQIDAGENHCCCLTTQGAVYCWGHVDSGRLGLGVKERFGARAEEKLYFPAPTVVSGLSAEPIIEVSCGAAHTLALSEDGKVFSWGLGAGGRLGLGDFHSRIEPYEVDALSNKCVLQVAAATWHSAAVVLVPPMTGSGWVYTWGSGYHGQLGHGRTQVQTVPTVVEALRTRNLSATSIRLGSHHSAMVAMDGELYTWGSNLHGCLGHAIRDQFVEHTADPGHASGFGAIVERVGRGMVRDYALGREFTVVATYPYEGPTEDVARKLMEEEAIRLDMLALEDEQLGGDGLILEDDHTMATGEDDMTVGDDTLASGKDRGPAGILDKDMSGTKGRKG